MADQGIKVSRAGYPVETAADNQLLFSSAFQSLIILYTGKLTAGSSFYHNLGYYPVTIGQANETLHGSQGGDISSISQSSTLRIFTNYIYNPTSHDVTYFIFSQNLQSTISARNIITTPATQSTPNQDYGFKVSTDGNEVTTATLQNLVAFSGISQAGYGVRQQLIHQMGYQNTIGSTSTTNFSHNLGYAPMFLAYYKYSSDNFYLLDATHYHVNDDATISIIYQATINSTQLSIYNNTGNNIDISYLIFKDPF